MKWIIKQKHDGMLLRDYLQHVQGISRRILKAVKYDGGKILVDGKQQSVRTQIKQGEAVQLLFPPEIIGNGMKAESMPLQVIYEDDAVLVIDKPSGVATIPSMNQSSGTIANGVLAHYQRHNLPYTVHVVTRLDRDTSGLLLIAKHRYSHSLLSRSQKTGEVKRCYQAIVEGELSADYGTISEPIGRKEGSIIERTVIESGKPAMTHYQVIQQKKGMSLVDIHLETGRTHQIRVHFSYIGHPLAGDNLYGGSKRFITRQALHCRCIAFVHPFTHNNMHFESPLPDDMAQFNQ
ncbi:RluA family pseudouridine synthase [Lentibacillus songyuanensis]|uniref:RluA family pseudouridine synthase n=1 Tax=Lentibacillus songyuanensis TaxID=3136161 RepID=UPI0038621D73